MLSHRGGVLLRRIRWRGFVEGSMSVWVSHHSKTLTKTEAGAREMGISVDGPDHVIWRDMNFGLR